MAVSVIRSNWKVRSQRAVAVAALVFGGFAHSARGQMVTADRMTHFADTFNVKNLERSPAFNGVVVDTNIPANILWPGDQPEITLQIQNNTNEQIKTSGKVDVIHYGTRGEPGDIWVPTVFKIDDAGSVPIEVDIPAHGFQNVKISPKIPATLGGYGLVIDLGDHGRRFVVSMARTFKPTTERIQYPSLSLDNSPGETLPRLGVQSIRYGFGFPDPAKPGYAKQMQQLDEELRDYQKRNITVMLMVMGGDADQPLGRARPHLDDQNVMLDTKSDSAWLPSEDEKFQQWTKEVAAKYGWPNGPITAMSLWNEPWEGISISGWGADMLRYREIFRHMAHGIIDARKEANVQVLIAGCDSSSNTIDKLFPDDSDEFLNLLDVCTIHYQGMSSPAMYKKWLDHKGPYGRIRIWDTESWVANTDDRVAAVIATNKSAGYDRAMGIFGGNIWDHETVQVMQVDGKKTAVRQDGAWALAASVGAAVHFIGERKFDRLLFQNGLPWVMLFHGLPAADGGPSPDDGTIVVVGDIGEEFGKNGILHRTVMGLKQRPDLDAANQQLAALPPDAPIIQRKAIEKQIVALSIIHGGTMVLDDAGGKFKLFDFYGNPVASDNGKITVPLDGRGFFLRSDGSDGSFARLTQAVADSRIDGFECLEMTPRDLLATVDTKPPLRITFTNMLNRPVSGKLTAKLGKLQVETLDTISFAAHESRDVDLKILGGDASADNSYPLSLRFDAGADGTCEHDETMHVNVIAHKTITVDGKLDDWAGVLPQTVVSTGSAAPTMQEAAYFPFKKFDSTVKTGFATGYLAYDDDNFYFAAKVADPDPDAGTLRFETRNDDQFFYPDKSYSIDPNKTFTSRPGVVADETRIPFTLQKPGSDERNPVTIESVSQAFKMKLHLPSDHGRQVALYFVDPDPSRLGRRVQTIAITDAKTGKTLGRPQQVKEFGHGTYAVYEMSGDVEITIRCPSTFLKAVVSGLFIDDSTSAKGGTTARFDHLDEDTAGNWQKTYGKLGYNIAGLEAKLPDGVTLEMSQAQDKIEHDWPAGVRHYSYARNGILPSGTSPNFDNVEIAFNAIPLDDDPISLPSPPGTPPMYTGYRDTDSSYALNKVADAYGGGTEIWRLDVPDHMRVHFFPREPKASWEGPVKNGKLVVTHDGATRITECAIPWSELPDVKKLLDAGKPVKFSFRVNNHSGGAGMELARDRGVAKLNSAAFQADWIAHWANELEFAFDKTPAK